MEPLEHQTEESRSVRGSVKSVNIRWLIGIRYQYWIRSVPSLVKTRWEVSTATKDLKMFKEAWGGQRAQTDQRKRHCGISTKCHCVWCYRQSEMRKKVNEDWTKARRTFKFSPPLDVRQQKKKKRRKIEWWGNWIEHLSGTEHNRVENVVRNCEEISKRYKEQRNRGWRKSKT